VPSPEIRDDLHLYVCNNYASGQLLPRPALCSLLAASYYNPAVLDIVKSMTSTAAGMDSSCVWKVDFRRLCSACGFADAPLCAAHVRECPPAHQVVTVVTDRSHVCSAMHLSSGV
jgi:hypothetical protein